ncbi:F-box protein At3g07870-like [Papaver somniferum]|uniref:F-box protein At3g07870-like n=1 Tax=Papaver somniferum TaxID=3469 RepID=UPI000E6FE077|nr:F-box protein At3g07870-like [Papaver somniferum]
MEYFKILPGEITLEILTRLPTESVLESKLVCTNWRNLGSHHPLFFQMHLNYLNYPSAADFGELGFFASNFDADNRDIKYWYFEYDHESTSIQRIRRVNLPSPPCWITTKFLGSCNGLICFAEYDHPCVWICNPITKERVLLPELERDSCDIDEYCYKESNFGYISSTNEYKVLGMYMSKTNVEVHIYSLGSGTGWRNLGKSNFEFNPYYETDGIFANEAIYWMYSKLEMIVAFNLAEEKFCELLSPPHPLPTGGDWSQNTIGALDGFLFFANGLGINEYGGETDCFDLWILKKKNEDHGMKEQNDCRSFGWTKEFRVGDRNRELLSAVANSGGVLTYNGQYLNVYDTKTSTSKRLVEFNCKFLEVLPHKNTLVSLKELGEEDTKTMESVETKETRSRNYPSKHLQEDAHLEYIYL